MLLELALAAALEWLSPEGAAAITACRQSELAWGEERASEEAECLVGAIYGPGRLERLDTLGRDAPLLFSRAALADMAAARSRSGGGLTPGLDAIPFCRCQDPVGLTLLTSVTQVSSDGTGAAGVTFIFEPISEDMETDELAARLAPENRTTLVLELVREEDGWRVDDIRDADGYAFRASLAP